jgi:hypothetical protein
MTALVQAPTASLRAVRGHAGPLIAAWAFGRGVR